MIIDVIRLKGVISVNIHGALKHTAIFKAFMQIKQVKYAYC